MFISSRLLRVIEYLRIHESTSIKELAKSCNITERMARYDIESLNFLLKINNIPQIEKAPMGGLIISKEFNKSKKVKDFKELSKYSKEEREEYIKAKLLIEGKINLTTLSKELNVSRTSIRGDMTNVSASIEDENIKIINNEIVSDERSIRHCILKNFSRELIKIQDKAITEELGLVHNYFRETCVDISQTMLRDLIEKIEKDMENENPNYFSPVWLNIIVAYMRIKSGNYRENLNEDQSTIGSKSYKIVSSYLLEIESILGIEFTKSEILGLARCTESCMSNKINSYIYENWVEIVIIIKNMINEISDHTDINLRNDDSLINGLMNHIKAAIYRIVKNIDLGIEICNEAIESHNEILEIVKRNIIKLENTLETKINKDEITLIAIHLIASVERNKEVQEDSKNVLLVCGGGYGTTSIVANRISSIFNVNIIDMVSHTNFRQYDLSKVDYVISVLNIKENTYNDKPILKITPFISEKDIVELRKYLPVIQEEKYRLNDILDVVNEDMKIENKDEIINFLIKKFENKKENKINKSIKDYIDLNKVDIIDRVYSWQESIGRAGELLEKSGDVEKEYTLGIINMAESIGAHFVLNNGVAIPHGEVNIHVNNSSVGILFVRQEVKFDYGRNGKLFFIIGAKTTKDHVKTIEEINKLSNNIEFIEKLDNVKDKGELVSLIYEYI